MINENLLEILKKVKNSEISIEDGTQELQNIKNNHSEVLFYQNDSILANQIVQKDIRNEYIIVLADDVEHINVIKGLNLDNTSSGNQLLWISRGNSFKQDFNSIEMDLNNEAHFEQLSDYVYSSYDNKKIRIIYMIGEQKSQTGDDWEYQVSSTGITALLFAKSFAYRFNKSGIRFQIFSTERDSGITVFQEAIVALGRSIEKEVPAFITQVIIINPQEVSGLRDVINTELHSEIDTRFIYYKSEKRMTYNISEMAFEDTKNCQEFPEGVYVILGGMGAIGKAVTTEIAKLSNTKIILVGRRKISDEIETYIEALRHGTNDITYISADISNHTDIKRMFHEVRSQFEKIDYVFHCAGILEDCRLPNKSVESFKRVISSKINGALAIIDMKRMHGFKKVLFFSSTSGVFGNEGQLDYAYANMLINSLCTKQSDPNIISISWPFWDTEGMKMPKEYKEKIFSAYGFRPMPTRVGIDIIKHTLADNSKSSIVLYGDRQKLESFSGNANESIERKVSSAQAISQEKLSANVNNDGLLDSVIMWITEIISKVTGIDTDSLTPKKPIQNLGIDSVMTTEINIEFEKVFDNISKTLLFEYRCIKEIAEHFIQNYYDACKNKFIKEKIPEKIVETVHNEDIQITAKDEIHEGDGGAFELAIIGIAGKYPKADNLDAFWENLKAGMDCVDVIPKSRWDYMNYCDDNAEEWWKSPEKWGGFIEGIDEFDSLVFNIAPAEAKAMDPHQRVYAQTVWHAFEDAGYNKKRLENYKVGVYTGAMWSNYQLYGIEDAYNGKMEGYDSSLASISNRISYIFNLHGPSITLDTMCSSSLTALQLAYQSIQNHDIDMAVVGGVNLTLHPYKYIQLKKGNFLSKDGRCRSFGEGGSGYVPGEGAGSFIVKPLDRALTDKDKIYGIIKGISINHGGKAQGYFVPNPIEQANVINDALENAGVDKKSISYIEAHGTGTSLGDPIEIAGLRKVFDKDNNQKQSISIGSVKSNIGHLEAAAGMASLTKVILQMKYKMLVPSIHAEKLNPNVDLKATPFKVQTQLAPWGGDDNKILRAGISSFGAGGANAHVVLEGYANSYKDIIEAKEKKIFVLSVKNEKALLRYIELYRNFLLETPQVAEEYEFDTRLAYTTQIGRNHMNVRVAIVFENTKQLIQCLEDVASGKVNRPNVFINNVSNDKLDVKSLDIETLKYDLSENAVEIAQAWADGYEVEWEKLYSKKMAIVNLPLYPFEKIKHWAPLGESRIYNMKNEAESISIDLYKKQWNKSEASSITTKIYNTNIVFLIQKEQSLLKSAVIEAMNLDGAEFLEVTDDYTVCETSFESKFNQKNKTVIIDLSDLKTGSEEIFEIPHSKFNLYKHLIKQTRQSSLDILHCTQGVNEGITQNGVLTAGLMKSLGAEYPWIHSKTIDFTMDYTMDSILNSLKHEFSFDGNSEFFYKKGIRNTTGYQQLEFNLRSDNVFKAEKDKCYIITGGTRGIGAQIASRLAELGAKKLVLLGRSDMNTPEKKELLKDLESHGAEVMVYSQGLNNKTALEDFFNQVYKNFGEAHIMFHCAGRYSTENAAFIHKEEREIEEVLEPKVSGLLNMLDATKALQVEKTILFSSISSVCPWLSKGVSDYTMANNYLNGMPEYGKNITASQVLSVVWQSWSDVGFMVSEPKIGKENGLIPINCKEGIDILFNILQKEVNGIVVPVKHNKYFDIEKLSVLSKSKSENKPESEFTRQTADNKMLSSEINEITKIITKVVSEVLLININEISLDEAFENYGMDSIFLGEVIKKLEEKLHTAIDPVLFFECNTIRKISTALTGIVNISLPKNESIEIKPWSVNENPRFAVIGADCRFPDADNCIEFWNNLMEEKCSVKEIPKERFDMEPFYSPTPKANKSVGKWAAMVKDIEYFDPKAFEISEAEAATMDPLIRIQLETSVNAIRNAGYDKADIKGKNIGVFIGSRVGDFHSLMPKEQKAKITGLGQNFIAAYTSHYLDLKGPSMVIDTACSSSLVALSEACKNILFGECEQAIVGGIDLILCENTLLLLSDALSPTGTCSAFDEKANGFVPGEGSGAIVIKKLEQAIADGDNILAVLESVAINNDGHTMGITTPNYNMQMDVIKRAIERTDINPEYISYIEAHGTGTFIGDPIELKALTSVFREYTDKKNYCGIGSVKTNIGHCLSAAGMASIIKVVLCLQNKMLPKTLNCDKPNSRFNFEQSPFFPCTSNTEWEGINGRRIAGISSFGFGGTNAHVILSEYTGHHEVRRRPLEPLALNKKYYWFDKKETTSTTIFNTNSEANMFGLKKMF